MNKIICPFHKINGLPERTPSCVVYSEHFHCYSCGEHGDHSRLRGIIDFGGNDNVDLRMVEREHLDESLNYIRSLGQSPVRGLQMHADRSAYYIIWPTGDYYKKRYFGDSSSRYYCPAGHPKPLFVLNPGKQGCIVVEGEINALSLATVVDQYTIVSPGGTDSFGKYLTDYKKYSKLIIIADKDPAGAEAIIKLKPKLLKYTSDVTHYLINPEKDLNDWLVKDGQEGLRSFVETELGLPTRLQRRNEDV